MGLLIDLGRLKSGCARGFAQIGSGNGLRADILYHISRSVTRAGSIRPFDLFRKIKLRRDSMSFQFQQACRNRILVFGLAALVVISTATWSSGAFDDPEEGGDKAIEIDAIFSPGGGCQERIAEEIGSAEKTLRIQAFYFTSKPITEAVVEAKKRGVAVTVVLDKSQEKMTYGSWRILKREGVPVYFDSKHATANNKVILIDDDTIITGSYNFTKAAEEKNAENVVIIKHADDVFEKFEKNFSLHLKHSKKYGG
jgi:phosphatidylserine/phosphatidylglycerophosphate/cardiolipin synthase-like enzyme